MSPVEYARASKTGLRAQLFLNAQRMVPLDHALASGERSHLELAYIPANGQVDNGGVFSFA